VASCSLGSYQSDAHAALSAQNRPEKPTYRNPIESQRQRGADDWAWEGLDAGQTMPRVQPPAVTPKRKAWNKGGLIGQKRPLLAKQIWTIRARLELAENRRDLAVSNVAIDSRLRGCDLVKLRVTDLLKAEPVREARVGDEEQNKTPCAVRAY